MSVEHYKNYVFQYCHDVDAPGKIRIYVLGYPSFRDRKTDPEITHLDPPTGRAPPKICIKGVYKPDNIEVARRFARAWADRTDTYIRTGVSISDQIAIEN